MMRLILSVTFLFFMVDVGNAQPCTRKTEVKNIMKCVADWQIAHFDKPDKYDDLDWTNATLYMGMVDWAELVQQTDNDDSYYKWLLNIGRRNHFQVGQWMYHADHIAVGQPFIDLYRKYGDKMMIAPVMARANWIVENPSTVAIEIESEKERWSWCDALFMAPPVYAKLYAITGDRKYLDFMNREYEATYNCLFDRSEKLFYRDSRYFTKKEANGRNIFWGRGNGWVLGGLVEILQTLPKDAPFRDFYEKLFITLVQRVADLQSPDGYWHASLLDPDSYPSPETSATGFIVYALAYGVNEGLLNKDTFAPIMWKGWNALVNAVNSEGKLGYVQPVGADPRKVTYDMTEVYGVGAFLLAGCQVYKCGL